MQTLTDKLAMNASPDLKVLWRLRRNIRRRLPGASYASFLRPHQPILLKLEGQAVIITHTGRIVREVP